MGENQNSTGDDGGLKGYLNSDLSSVFANHRLNMAAPISHARFYIGVLIRALST